MWRGLKDGDTLSKKARYNAKKERQRRRGERERARRDAEVTEKWGHKAHWACGRKVRYRCEHDATEMMKKMYPHSGRWVGVYRCPYCNGWHMTKHLRGESDEGLGRSEVLG